MSDQIWLLDAGYLDGDGSPGVLRASSAQDFMTRPSETPPHTAYLPTLLTTGIIERHAWAKYTTRGLSSIGFGVPVLDNSPPMLAGEITPGPYDNLRNYGFDGQPLVLRKGPRIQGAYPQDYPAYFTGTMEGAFFPWRQVQLLLRDMLGLFFQKPIQTALYGGTNALPDGFDGVATDLQGKCKPLLLGSAANFSPPCVNTSKLTYQVTDRTTITVGSVTISAVYDKGVALTVGSSYPTVAALQAAATAAGHFDYCDDPVYGAFFQLGSTPAGPVTCDASASVDTVAGILSAIMTGPGGILPGAITGTQALSLAAPGVVGYWVDTAQHYCGDVIKLFLDTCNGYLVDSRDGIWRMGLLDIPAGALVKTFRAAQIKGGADGINIIQGNDLGSDAPQTSGNTPSLAVPVWRVVVNYDMNQTVQTEADIAGAGLVRLGHTKQQYRQVSVEDASVLAKHPLAVTLTVNTLYRNAADALAEGQRQLRLRKVAPTVVEVPVDPDDAADLDLMEAPFGLAIDRFNWPNMAFWPIGFVDDPGDAATASMTTIVAWGIDTDGANVHVAPALSANTAWSMNLPSNDLTGIDAEGGVPLLDESGEVILSE